MLIRQSKFIKLYKVSRLHRIGLHTKIRKGCNYECIATFWAVFGPFCTAHGDKLLILSFR